jgi:hypothetical protein
MKQCSKCNETKSLDEFSWKDKSAGRKSTICKTCHRAYSKQHYSANREKYLKKSMAFNEKRSKELREHVWTYLQDHPCIDCGESDPIVLEFDHVRGDKEYSIGNLMGGGYSLELLRNEIQKCDVRCSNCHIRKHARENNTYRHVW